MIKYLINAISRGLSFSKSEARGTLLLIFIILTAYTATMLYTRNVKKSQMVDYTSTESFVEWVEEVQASTHVTKAPHEIHKDKYQTYSNDASYSNREVKKNLKAVKSEWKQKAEHVKISDINEATAKELRTVKGIGEVYSKRIIKFRDKLGGFNTMEQLDEVYGLDTGLITKIKKRFSVQSDVTPLAINSDSAKLLAQHPYISYDLAWVLINYRKQHGNINGIDDLTNIKAIGDSVIQKLRPYLN